MAVSRAAARSETAASANRPSGSYQRMGVNSKTPAGHLSAVGQYPDTTVASSCTAVGGQGTANSGERSTSDHRPAEAASEQRPTSTREPRAGDQHAIAGPWSVLSGLWRPSSGHWQAPVASGEQPSASCQQDGSYRQAESGQWLTSCKVAAACHRPGGRQRSSCLWPEAAGRWQAPAIGHRPHSVEAVNTRTADSQLLTSCHRSAASKLQTALMFFWPCIMNWLCIKYQFDALIIIYS